MKCPKGHIGVLRTEPTSPEDHEILEDGTVNPSVECPEPGCGFHEIVKLEQWQEPL